MTWVEFRLNVNGEEQVARGFETSQRNSQDMRDPLGRIGEQVRLSVSEQMRTEGVHGLGTKWKALNPDYARWKHQAVGEEPILVFSGRMRDTLLSRAAITVEPQRLIYRPEGEHEDVAAYHQDGSGHLPARKIVAITQAEKRTMERTFLEWIRRDPIFSAR